MLNLMLPLLLAVALIGCVSPAAHMTPQEISMLSNEQLCQLKNSYPWEQATEIEVGRRNLNCDPAYQACLASGHKPRSAAMGLCIEQTRQSWALQRQVQEQQAELERQNMYMRNQIMWNNTLERSHPARRQIVKTPTGTIIQEY